MKYKKLGRIIFSAGAMFAGISSIAVSSAMATESTSSDRPNIVFLFSDDHAYRAISAYGSGVNQTPNIDRIAAGGAVFNRNYCANSICAPSRACILTGKHSHSNGQMTNHDTFDGNQQTFPKLLQGTGYTSGIFGKWHLKSDPTGFDEWMVYPGQGSYYNPDYLTPEGKQRIEGYSVDVTTDLALDFMRRKKDADQPFLLMCQFKAPHRNWMPGPKYLNMYDDVEIPEPATLFDDYSGREKPAAEHKMGIDQHMTLDYDLKVLQYPGPYKKAINNFLARMTPEQRKIWDEAYEPKNQTFLAANLEGRDLVRWKYQRYMKDYLRCVAAVDDNVGRVLDYLKENGLEKNTIVIYSSDQGFYLGEHGWFDKRWMYEESFRMPLMMRWPGRIQPGTSVDKLTQNIDYAPTLLEAAGVDVPSDIQGASFLPLLEGKPVDWRTSLYYHYYEHDGGHGVHRHYGVRTERYKLIQYYGGKEPIWELFDLQQDPNEMRSVYSNPEYAPIRKELEGELGRLRKQFDMPADNMDAEMTARRKMKKKK